MERLLNDQIVDQIRQVFSGLKEPVHVLVFTRQQDCEYCEETRRLIEEVAAISDLLSFSVHDIEAEAEKAAEHSIAGTPALVIAAKDGDQLIDYGIRFLGIPSGHEFTSLIQDILLVSGRDSGLGQAVRDYLARLEKPVHLQVFVTPT